MSQFIAASLSWFISVQRKSAVWHAWCKPQPTPLKPPHLIRICTSVGVFFTSSVISVQAAFISLDSCVLQLILWRVIHLTLTVSQTIWTILMNCLQTHLLNAKLNWALHTLILPTYFSIKVQRKYAKSRLTCFYLRTLSWVAMCWALKSHHTNDTFADALPSAPHAECFALNYTKSRGEASATKKHWKQSVHVLCKNQK